MLVKICEGIWSQDFDLKMWSGVYLPARMLVVRLSDGGLLLHSPGRFQDDVAKEIAALGEVKVLVAPNCYHHFYLGKAMERYPDANVYHAPGLETKRSDLKLKEALSPEVVSSWGGEIESILLEGLPLLNETVFFHKPSRTLIVTDLVFHILEPKGWLTPWVLQMFGTYKRFGVSRLLKRAVKDRAAMKRSLEAMMLWDFDRVVMAHGVVLERGGKEQLRKQLTWFLR